MAIKAMLSILALIIISSCTTTGPGVLGKKSYHEQYGNKIKDAGLKETALGSQWFAAAENALLKPLTINLPYKETGYFAAEKPSATSISFNGKKGEKLIFQLEKKPNNGFIVFTELWRIINDKPTLLHSLDTALRKFDFEVEDNGKYILRLQPELLKSGEYTLSITVSSTLAFPVAGNNAKIGSVWGDDRDGGVRRHEGIDIFAPKRTPVLAAYDGTITRVNENNLGGKTVWLRPSGKDYTLYYAHLDEQLSSPGQKVEKGDTVGLVGNTGNAISTPPHLHFGIYTLSGAIDPLPFINPITKIPANITISSNLLKGMGRLKKRYRVTANNLNIELTENSLVKPIAITAKEIRVELPDGYIIELPVHIIESANTAIRSTKPKVETFIHASPNANAPRKIKLKETDAIKIYGIFNEHAFVSFNNTEGWVPLNAL